MSSTSMLPTRPAGSSAVQPSLGRKFTPADIISTGNKLPNRYILHALEGWGKTSFAAQFKAPVFLQSRGETGLEALINAGQLPEIPHFPELLSWKDMLSAVDFLIDGQHEFKTVVIDTINGSERLCHEHVCERDFNSDWTDRGFTSYNKGFEVSLAEWRVLLTKLDQLREKRGALVFCLCHTKVKAFKNPNGADFDRYAADMHEKTWGLSHKWADCVLFGEFSTTVIGQHGKEQVDVSKRGKGTGGSQRVMHVERTAAWDAKNRLGLSGDIDMGNSSAEAFANFSAAVKAAAQGGAK